MRVERKSSIQKETNNTSNNHNTSNMKQSSNKKNLIATTEKFEYVDLILYDKKGKLVWFRKRGIYFDIKC